MKHTNYLNANTSLHNDDLERKKKQAHIYFALQPALEVSPTLYGLVSKPVVFLAEDGDFHTCPIS